jgi:NAD(P)-dependent dehydrogenase (short-subunit alcohol dehydrogenase family)
MTNGRPKKIMHDNGKQFTSRIFRHFLVHNQIKDKQISNSYPQLQGKIEAYNKIVKGFPWSSAYVSTKFAVEGLSESMSYELEPFGIKMVLVEPGVIKTNFVDGMVIARKSQDPKSPYSQIIQKMATGFEEMIKNGSSPDLVAKVVLNAAINENPSLRYLAGNDVEQWLGNKRNMSDEEFYKMMKQNLKM